MTSPGALFLPIKPNFGLSRECRPVHRCGLRKAPWSSITTHVRFSACGARQLIPLISVLGFPSSSVSGAATATLDDLIEAACVAHGVVITMHGQDSQSTSSNDLQHNDLAKNGFRTKAEVLTQSWSE